MILFVFEGSDDCEIMNTIKALYPKAISEDVVCLYKNNIYQLYSKMKSADSNPDFTQSLLSVLKSRPDIAQNEKIANADEDTFSQVFLFFDYEPQHRKKDEEQPDLEILNRQLAEMVDFFDDETGNGKLYVSYPMAEALFYTKKLPDLGFVSCCIDLAQAKIFKDLTHDYSDYKSNDFLQFNIHELNGKKIPRESVSSNWKMVVNQNIVKANYICNGKAEYPESKDLVTQKRILENQLAKYIAVEKIAVLSAFPMFLYEYLKEMPDFR